MYFSVCHPTVIAPWVSKTSRPGHKKPGHKLFTRYFIIYDIVDIHYVTCPDIWTIISLPIYKPQPPPQQAAVNRIRIKKSQYGLHPPKRPSNKDFVLSAINFHSFDYSQGQ